MSCKTEPFEIEKKNEDRVEIIDGSEGLGLRIPTCRKMSYLTKSSVYYIICSFTVILLILVLMMAAAEII